MKPSPLPRQAPECIVGYPDTTYPPKPSPSPLWGFALPMVGVAMVAAAVIGLAHWIYR